MGRVLVADPLGHVPAFLVVVEADLRRLDAAVDAVVRQVVLALLRLTDCLKVLSIGGSVSRDVIYARYQLVSTLIY